MTSLTDRLPRTCAVLFDLDGTLVDSVPDIAAAAEHMLAAMKLPACGETAVRMAIGNGVEKLVERLLEAVGGNSTDNSAMRHDMERALGIFRAAYAAAFCVHSKLYPGVEDCLRTLQASGLKLGIITNKPAAFTGPLIEQLGIAGCFSVVLSGDSLPVKKPDPLPLIHAMSMLGVDASMTIMVGDSKHDIAAARAAGLPAIAVPYGYNHGEPIADSLPDLVLQSLDDLPGLLRLDKR